MVASFYYNFNTNPLRICLGAARSAWWPVSITISIQIHYESVLGRLGQHGGQFLLQFQYKSITNLSWGGSVSMVASFYYNSNANPLRICLGAARSAWWPVSITIPMQIHYESVLGRLGQHGGQFLL